MASVGTSASPIVMGAAVAEERREAIHEVLKPAEKLAAVTTIAPVQILAPNPAEDSATSEQLRAAILAALSEAGQRMLVSMLESGEWTLEGNELVIKVAASAAVIDMSLSTDARKIAVANASSLLGRTVKLKVVSGDVSRIAPPTIVTANENGRSRAEQDPVVRKMKEKFGAEIRTIIDYRTNK